MGEAVPGGGEVPHERVHVALARHLLDVGAGSECLLRPGDDEAADPGIRLERIDGIRDLHHHRGIERIERVRPVQPDQADPTLGLDDDVLVAHGAALVAREA